jgi:hypothetical protein
MPPPSRRRAVRGVGEAPDPGEIRRENYGYLRIDVDKQYLKIGFHQVGVRSLAQSRYDMVTVRLADHHLVAN